MNKLIIIRQIFTDQSTIGRLIVQPEGCEGEYLCDTLEDRYRDLTKEQKVFGETSIPYGCYDATMSMWESGGYVTPILYGVPKFSGIRIHKGNDKDDTNGCILVGYNSAIDFIKSSRVAFNDLMQRISMWDKFQVEIIHQKIG